MIDLTDNRLCTDTQAAAYARKTASIRLLWPFLSLARECGRDTSYVEPYLGLTTEELQNPDTRVPQQQLYDLLQTAISRSGVRDLGLMAASYVDATYFGVSEYIARSRPTLRDAIQSALRYLPLLSEGLHGSIVESTPLTRVRVRFDPALVVHNAAYEFVVATAILRVRRIAGHSAITPVIVSFMHSKPESTVRHQAMFGCPVRFGAKHTEIIVSSNLLDLRMPYAEPALSSLLARAADLELQRLQRRGGLAERIEIELAHHVDLRDATVDLVARTFGCSTRTLHRRLTKEGTSYRALLDRVRARVAMRQLEQTDQSIARIANELGFSTPQCFHRSFKRCTGLTAAAYRRRTRAHHVPTAAPQ